MMTGRQPVPGPLWVFVIGFAVYFALPVLPLRPFMPANPIAVFAVATAAILMWRRDTRSYWVTVAVALLAVWYPVFVLPSWLRVVGRPALTEIFWIFLTPALLLCLLFSADVRRYAHLDLRDRETDQGFRAPSGR